MPLDPCQDGCLNHNIPSNTVPLATDDPCNGAGNGYFCQGSYWLYDPTEPGADTATNGDCSRLFLRNGGDCGVYQWIEIALAGLRSEAAAPVDGDDCCPPGTLWCVPPAGAVTATQIWISTDGCGGACTWCKLCGHGQAVLTLAAPVLGIPENITTPVPFDTVVSDTLDGVTLPTYTVPEAGCYMVTSWAQHNYTGINFDASLLRLILLVNGAPAFNLQDTGGWSLNRPLFNPIVMPIAGTGHVCVAAGTTLGIGVNWSTNFGGQTIDLLQASMRIKMLKA